MLRVLTCFFLFDFSLFLSERQVFDTRIFRSNVHASVLVWRIHKVLILFYLDIYFFNACLSKKPSSSRTPINNRDVLRQQHFYCVYHPLHYISEMFCLSLLGRGRRVGIFVSIGGTGILFHLLVTASKEAVPSEELMLQLHLLLAKVGPKGRRTASHLNLCTHHPAGFRPYSSVIVSEKTIIFFSGVFLFPFI